MNDEAFEWDEAKARSNRTKHGVDFETAVLVFGDANAIEEYDARAARAEERWLLIGMAEERILVVVYTMRENRIRIISARRATRHEQDVYYRANAR